MIGGRTLFQWVDMFMSLYRMDLPVSDLEQAESFYRKLLSIPNRRVSPSLHHFDCGGMILTCSDADPNQESGNSAPRAIYFAVEDLETRFYPHKKEKIERSYAYPSAGHQC